MTQPIQQTPHSEIVEIISSQGMRGAKWEPVAGEETYSLFNHLKLDEASKHSVLDEAISVLARCVPPSVTHGTETGLVIGYVQSGKTMSFTAVTALARDNGFRLIIVVTGLTTNLFKQSTDRIKKDLRWPDRTDRSWKFFHNPKARPEVRQEISLALNTDAIAPGMKTQTILVTVMKNKTHLRNLIDLLTPLNLAGVPTLIIDDEADQASLNNQVRQQSESATYHQIVEIRGLLPHHTFLQYTATPQALLLINLIDVLSPSFAVLLTPGAAYAGGKVFFEGNFDLIRAIPVGEIPTKNQPLLEPPDSLMQAMRVFYLGVAVGFKEGRYHTSNDNRTMMVHPSKETAPHASYAHWVRQIRHRWSTTLSLDERDPDRVDLLDDFALDHQDLCRTVDNMPPFDELVPYLATAVNTALPVEVNAASGKTPQPDWRQQYAHIVIGGEVLNRGYTLEGLTVSYMPRGRGVGNADTIQQRARWFGYKADYLGFCRVYLSNGTLRAYQSYVAHEEDIRRQLAEHVNSGRPLSEWRRVFLLSPALRPTRHNVLDLDYVRGNYSDNWFHPLQPHCSSDAVEANRTVVNQFLSSLELEPDLDHVWRTETQRHSVAPFVSLARAYEDFLLKLRWAMLADSQHYFGLMLQLTKYLEQYPSAQCAIYYMSQGQRRERSTDLDGNIKELFSGYQIDKDNVINYPGDKAIRASRGVSIQVHRLVVKTQGQHLEDVPLVAVWAPKEVSVPWVAQPQGGTEQDF